MSQIWAVGLPGPKHGTRPICPPSSRALVHTSYRAAYLPLYMPILLTADFFFIWKKALMH